MSAAPAETRVVARCPYCGYIFMTFEGPWTPEGHAEVRVCPDGRCKARNVRVAFCQEQRT